MGRVTHKAGNYPLDDVMAKPNLYSGFPIMQFISLETGLAWRNNASSSKLLRYSTPSVSFFPFLFFFYFAFSFSSSFVFIEFTPSCLIAFLCLHLYGLVPPSTPASPPNLLTHFIPLSLSSLPLEIYFIIIFASVRLVVGKDERW